MDASELSSLLSNHSEMLGLPCWGTRAGLGTGSIFTLQLGLRLPIERTVKASGKVYEYEPSSHGVMVWSPWSLKRGPEFICDSTSDNENDGEMVRGLNLLVGENIVSISFDTRSFDLKIVFSNSLILECVCEPNDEDYTQYTIFFERFSVTVEGDLIIRKEMRTLQGL